MDLKSIFRGSSEEEILDKIIFKGTPSEFFEKCAEEIEELPDTKPREDGSGK